MKGYEFSLEINGEIDHIWSQVVHGDEMYVFNGIHLRYRKYTIHSKSAEWFLSIIYICALLLPRVNLIIDSSNAIVIVNKWYIMFVQLIIMKAIGLENLMRCDWLCYGKLRVLLSVRHADICNLFLSGWCLTCYLRGLSRKWQIVVVVVTTCTHMVLSRKGQK